MEQKTRIAQAPSAFFRLGTPQAVEINLNTLLEERYFLDSNQGLEHVILDFENDKVLTKLEMCMIKSFLHFPVNYTCYPTNHVRLV